MKYSIPTLSALFLAGAMQMALAQTATTTAPNIETTSQDELRQSLDQAQQLLKDQAEALRLLRQEVELQGKEIAELRGQSSNPTREAAQLQAAVTSMKPAAAVAAISQIVPSSAKTTEPAPAELFFRIGNATFTPGGWVDFTAYHRTTNVGSGIGTSFANIPFKNTPQAGVTETRMSAQSSRLSIRVDEKIRNIKVYGYAEVDFNGYLPSNAYVTTNSNTFRMRVYYLNLTRGKWEFLGGQGWSLITPNRKAISPFLSDIFNTFHIDTNYQVGLPYSRQAQFRVVYHPTSTIAAAVSVENAEQYSGSAVTFPSLFNTCETDVNSSTGSGGGTATPNLHPDVVAKVTMDRKVRGLLWHVGAAGLLTSARTFTPATVTKNVGVTDAREGGAGVINANLEILKGFRLITVGYWSDGGGRYIGGLGPGFVALQRGSTTAPFATTLIHSGSGIGGFEWKMNPRTTVSSYYGGAYFQRRYALDPSQKTPTYVGYGYPGSPNTQNRAIQELSFATTTTLWQQPVYGGLQFVTQTSYVTRAPWYVAPGAPRNAHTVMSFMSIRYILP